MPVVIEAVLVSVIGWVNVVVRWATRGRVTLYRFYGTSGVRLSMVGPDTAVAGTVELTMLRDGDDLVVLAAAAETGRVTATLCAATAVTAELAAGWHTVVDVQALTGEAERAALRDRLLAKAALDERYEIRRRHEFPVARLTPHERPVVVDPVAFSGI